MSNLDISNNTWIQFARELVIRRAKMGGKERSFEKVCREIFGVPNFDGTNIPNDVSDIVEHYHTGSSLDDDYPFIPDLMTQFNIEYSSYYGLVNSASPYWKAFNGDLPLTPENFRKVHSDSLPVMNLKHIDIEHNFETDALLTYPGRYKDIETANSWNIDTLKEAIIQVATKLSPDLSILKFGLILPTDSDLYDKCELTPLPGFGIPYYNDNHKIWDQVKKARKYKEEREECYFNEDGDLGFSFEYLFWKGLAMKKIYYIMVYDALISTILGPREKSLEIKKEKKHESSDDEGVLENTILNLKDYEDSYEESIEDSDGPCVLGPMTPTISPIRISSSPVRYPVPLPSVQLRTPLPCSVPLPSKDKKKEIDIHHAPLPLPSPFQVPISNNVFILSKRLQEDIETLTRRYNEDVRRLIERYTVEISNSK